jgi:hypothetical protein
MTGTRPGARSCRSRRALPGVVFCAVVVACGGSVTNVGSLGASDHDAGPSTLQDGAMTPTDPAEAASTNPGPDAGDAGAVTDAPASECAAGTCGAKACGRDECGRTCGVCASVPSGGGCLAGRCADVCPSAPCLDADGQPICEGERGARHCAGGPLLGIQVCTCSGAGHDAWIDCGACL